MRRSMISGSVTGGLGTPHTPGVATDFTPRCRLDSTPLGRASRGGCPGLPARPASRVDPALRLGARVESLAQLVLGQHAPLAADLAHGLAGLDGFLRDLRRRVVADL